MKKMCNNCNPCDECAPKCQECCNPNIQGDGCITVDTSEEGVITIHGTCPTEVSSDDDSISVVKKTPHEGYSERFDLSINKPDERVGACDSDTNPGYLYTKIVAGHGLDKSLINCPGDASVELRVDENELHIDNNKVAVGSGCDEDYLGNLINNNSNLVELVQTGCKMTLRDKTQGFVCGKITMQANVKGDVAGGGSDGTTYYIAGSTGNGLRNGVFNIDFLYGMETANNDNGLKIEYDGIYEVGFRCSLEASFGIHAVRGGLYVLRASGGYQEVCESRFSAPVGNPPFTTGHGEQGFNALYVNDCTETTGVNGQSASLGATLDRMPCEGTTRIILYKGDILFLGMKGQARTQYTSGDTISWDALGGEIAMLGAAGNQAGTDIGAQIWADLKHYL